MYTYTRAPRSIYSVNIQSVILVSGETLGVSVAAKEYLDKLVDKNLIKIYAIATVKETGQTWSEEDDFQLQKPKLNVQVQQSRCSRSCQNLYSSPDVVRISTLTLCVPRTSKTREEKNLITCSCAHHEGV
jgi:hypothetical protein